MQLSDNGFKRGSDPPWLLCRPLRLPCSPLAQDAGSLACVLEPQPGAQQGLGRGEPANSGPGQDHVLCSLGRRGLRRGLGEGQPPTPHPPASLEECDVRSAVAKGVLRLPVCWPGPGTETQDYWGPVPVLRGAQSSRGRRQVPSPRLTLSPTGLPGGPGAEASCPGLRGMRAQAPVGPVCQQLEGAPRVGGRPAWHTPSLFPTVQPEVRTGRSFPAPLPPGAVLVCRLAAVLSPQSHADSCPGHPSSDPWAGPTSVSSCVIL